MGFLDIGSGLNAPGWHTASKYCKWVAGIEIDETLYIQAATLSIQLLEPGVHNHRVTLLCGDILKKRPRRIADIIYLFDLAFWPELCFDIFDWVARSGAEYVVTFKPARKPGYYKDVLKLLNATEIG